MVEYIYHIINENKTKKKRASPLFFCFLLNSLLDLGSLAHTVTQIVQLCTTNLALTDGLDHCNVGSVQGENLLAANTVGDTANGDALSDAAVLLSNDGALEDLDTLTSAFLDLHVDADGIADFHSGDFLELLFAQCLNQIHGYFPPKL